MSVENNVYFNFKSYNHYQNSAKKPKQQTNVKALLGATIGMGSAIAITSRAFKGKELPTHQEVAKMLIMAGGANLGGVVGGSIGADEKQKEKKWKEAGFQMLNVTAPMLMVSSFLGICNKTKSLKNNAPVKIIGSLLAMTLGAYTATKISNTMNDDDEPDRKYTYKDTFTNFDDIVATIKIGFREFAEKIPVDKILPFIYIYNGFRAGNKE